MLRARLHYLECRKQSHCRTPSLLRRTSIGSYWGRGTRLWRRLAWSRALAVGKATKLRRSLSALSSVLRRCRGKIALTRDHAPEPKVLHSPPNTSDEYRAPHLFRTWRFLHEPIGSRFRLRPWVSKITSSPTRDRKS